MNLNITGHQIDVTDGLRDQVNGKFEKIERHFDHLIDVHVILKVEHLDHIAEANIVTRGKTLFADAKASDMYAAIDALTDKLDRQVIKHKEKLTHRQRGPAARMQAD